MRIKTVRAKLLLLVALPLAMVLMASPLLSKLLEGQLVEDVDDRLQEAERSFQIELDDDFATVRLAAVLIASSPETRRALETNDASEPLRVARVFSEIYPHIDIIIADRSGRVLADVGPSDAPLELRQIPELGNLEDISHFHGVLQNGCTAVVGSAPARAWVETVGELGAIIVCERIDQRYVDDAAHKVGLELMVVDASRDDTPIESTRAFPRTLTERAGREPRAHDVDGTTWAIARFEPTLLAGAHGKLATFAAMDVSQLRATVHRHLYWSLLALFVGGVISVAIGLRQANRMSNALSRVSMALREIENQNYVSVDPVRTGDELEDLATGFNAMVEGLKERDKLRHTFGKYMTESVMEHLLRDKVKLGGETLTVTILFTDIRGFTSISEHMDAQALVGLLNEYFTEMVGIVMEHDGVVDKYIGDAIMAVFGAPVPGPDDAVNAVRAAVKMRATLDSLNARLAERGMAPLRTGIGVHTGEVVAGNIGSERRMEYTVIGDSVNLASRLEGSTKDLGVDVLISADTYALTEHAIEARPVREIQVKGRAEPVMTYAVTGLRSDAGARSREAQA